MFGVLLLLWCLRCCGCAALPPYPPQATALAKHAGFDVAWLPSFFDKQVDMSTGRKVAIGASASVVGLIILI